MLNLVVVAHPDDEILGFGATGAKLVASGETVQPVILCGNVDMRTSRPSDEDLLADIQAANKRLGFAPPVLGAFPNIRMNAVPHIELVLFIEKQIAIFSPRRIFTHHGGDLNDDHLQVTKACLAAARYFQRKAGIVAPSSLHAIEVPSSTDWAFAASGPPFSPNLFVEIGAYLEDKIAALSCYRNVSRDFPHPRSREILTGLAAYRGGQGGMKYAEAFHTLFQRELY